MLNFFAKYIGVKAADASDSVLELLVSWDPKGASEADIRVREEFLDKVSAQLVAMRAKFANESRELNNRVTAFARRLTAAEDLQRQVEVASSGSPEQARLSASLEKLLSSIERDQPEIDRAKADTAETESWLKEREDAFAQAKDALLGAKSALKGAQRDMARAQERRDREVERTDEARVVAGLRPDSSRLDKALNAMRRATEQANQEEEVARLKREALRPDADITSDPDIAAALARAKGEDTAPKSAADRIAALKMKAA